MRYIAQHVCQTCACGEGLLLLKLKTGRLLWQKFVATMKEWDGKTIRYATLCSGSEAPAVAFAALIHATNLELGQLLVGGSGLVVSLLLLLLSWLLLLSPYGWRALYTS